ncbi:hypothetical protein BEN30_12330 [Magnetovibrio blakemorei]|uniref:Uncharacterized protein n=2 Tax=Magnetovibrio blakemorei TaxID=28181 RepID=A0A1E5Q694_9PROT|nr:hypothetical protein BEN30_12330 [Magnetovibrio blakemorei]
MATAGYMEQLTDPIFKLDALAINGEGERVPFSLSIFRGGIEELGHFCLVRCPYIRSRDLKIIGGDHEEALANAILFTESYLKNTGTRLVDHGGREVCLPPYEYTVEEP